MMGGEAEALMKAAWISSVSNARIEELNAKTLKFLTSHCSLKFNDRALVSFSESSEDKWLSGFQRVRKALKCYSGSQAHSESCFRATSTTSFQDDTIWKPEASSELYLVTIQMHSRLEQQVTDFHTH